MTNNALQYDVVIAGAGLAGASIALALTKLKNASGQPLSIALIEAFELNHQLPKNYDARVIALSHGSAQYLQTLGAWSSLKSEAMAINDIHVSDKGHYGKARLQASDYDVSALGYVCEIQAIGNSLLTPLHGMDNVDILAPESIANINWQRDLVEVALKSGKSIEAKLLLGCDGGHSLCRAQANIDVHESDYQQVAIIANVSTQIPHKGRAFERFSDSGPVALLPMTDNRSSLVWTVKQDEVDAIMGLDDQGFAKALQNYFGDWLGTFTQVGKRFAYDLKLVQAHQSTHHRMALLGNASHTLHPIAGQGFNLGMRDVQVLAEILSQALKQGDDIGSYRVLRQYAEQRQGDHQQTITLTNSLVHLFSNQYLPLVVGRGIGLKVLNYVPALKSLLAQKTMGHTK